MNVNQNKIYDLAIVGGGLAGLTLAIQMADTGFKVLLFEKENYPFHKVCGEYISMESWDFLCRSGLALHQLSLPIINKLVVSDTKGKDFHFSLPLGGFGISRYKLDNALYHIALSKGVDIQIASKVNEILFINDQFHIKVNEMIFVAKTAAGCYGKRSNLDIKWKREFINRVPNKINQMIGVKYHIQYDHDVSTIALHNFINGYCGISKVEDDVSCLCYLTTAQNLQSSGNSIGVMEKNILSKNPKLKQIFQQATFVYDQPLTISQVSFQKKSQIENHVLMIGDTAGLIPPLCGNGMSMAMHAANIAAGILQQYLSNKINRYHLENQYTKSWQREFALRTRIGGIVQSLFGAGFTTSVFLEGMQAIPSLSKLLIKQTHGKAF